MASNDSGITTPTFPVETGTPSDTILVDSLLTFAWECSSKNSAFAIEHATRALKISERLNYEIGVGNALHILGTTYWYISNYDKAVDYLFRAMSLRERINDQLGLGRSYNNIGLIYFDRQVYEEALSYFQRSLAIRTVLKDSLGLVYSYKHIADVYRMQNRFEVASNVYRQGLNIAKAVGTERGESFIYYNIGQLYRQRNQLDSAENYFQKALKQARHIEYKVHEIKVLNAYADLLLQDNGSDLTLIQDMAERSLELSAQLHAQEQQKEAARILAIAAARQGQYAEAYTYQKLYQELYESYLNESTQRTVLEIEANYATAQKEKQLLEKEQEVGRLNFLLLATLFVSLLVIFISIILRFRSERHLRQILERKNREIAQQNQALLISNDTLEQFAYVASHDLKEPLRNIGSFSTLLERRFRERLGEEGKEYIKYISTSVRQMYELLEDILTYSKLESIQSSKAEVVDINEVVMRVKQSMEMLLLEKNAQIIFDELPSVKTHPTQMQQLFQNLISNGLKFNESPNPEVRVTAKVEKHMVSFAISDNGIGIEPAYREKIFQVFQRLHKGAYPGTGIGLAICARIVNQWGGQIWVEDNPKGQGSSFCFTLPYGVSTKPSSQSVSADARHPASFPVS